MTNAHDSDRDTFTRILVAIAVNDAEPQPARSEFDQLAEMALRVYACRVVFASGSLLPFAVVVHPRRMESSIHACTCRGLSSSKK